jgi:hypothetical protein
MGAAVVPPAEGSASTGGEESLPVAGPGDVPVSHGGLAQAPHVDTAQVVEETPHGNAVTQVPYVAAAVPHVDPVAPAPQAGAQAPQAPHLAGTAEAAGKAQAPAQTPTPRQTTTIPVETLSGRFIRISLWRAFRLQIHSREVLRSERKTLAEDAEHIVDPEQQAFLAWRRSVLLLVAIAFVPLTVLRFVEAFQGPPVPPGARVFLLMPAFAEGLFCVIAFDQLKNWTKWKQQRRVLLIAWGLYTLAPFLVYLYPFRDAYDGLAMSYLRQAAEIGGGMRVAVTKDTAGAAVGLAFGFKALFVLGPKIVSLMPGLIRASIVSKLLFPGMSAPGWLMILAAPFYALLVYVVVLMPYQLTGSWFFVGGIVGLLAAQVFIAWSGQVFTSPLDADDAHHKIHRAWLAYILLMGMAGSFIVLGLYEFIGRLDFGVIRIFSSVVSFFANVLLLTLIFTDGIVGGMSYFRKRVFPDPRREKLLRESEQKLDRFST